MAVELTLLTSIDVVLESVAALVESSPKSFNASKAVFTVLTLFDNTPYPEIAVYLCVILSEIRSIFGLFSASAND